MTDRTATLRQITDAIAAVRDMSDTDREKLYSRARTMRDRNLICTESPRAQGKEIQYSGADIAAAVVAITVSLNGGSQGKIAAINRDLRMFGDNQSGLHSTPAYEDNLDAILAGDPPIFIRYDVIALPWAHTRTQMGALNTLGLPDWSATTETTLIPVTALVNPVFAAIFGQD